MYQVLIEFTCLSPQILSSQALSVRPSSSVESRQSFRLESLTIIAVCRLKTKTYPHEFWLISLRLHRHCGAVRHIIQAFVCSIVQRLSRVVFPGVIRHLVVSLQQTGKSRSCTDRRRRLYSNTGRSKHNSDHVWLLTHRAGPDVGTFLLRR